MRLPLVALAMSLLCDTIGSQGRPDAQQDRSEGCRNCEECSRDNGCVRCAERLFLFLRRDGMSQHGTCVHACPKGFFGQRAREVNRCFNECVSTPPSGWSVWSVCLRDGAPCGFRWGRQTRTRGSAAPKEAPGPDRTGCPSQSETRRCRMKRRCPKDGRRPRARGREGPQKPLWMLATGKDGNAVGIF
ncbi:R-spondin-4 isoform X2 [Phyllopteryx taeniolatus]|uniref:R-spondin-4 isoform X2 n=1 Tax=Phyllopteryx taeniolatus TaxID=161469 RepID=UPI002AD3D6A2|nr:R-spondin-4 isoform X2 [Phyllopteryx taeniolatus]